MLTSDLNGHCAIILDSHLKLCLLFLVEHYLDNHKCKARITGFKLIEGTYYAALRI